MCVFVVFFSIFFVVVVLSLVSLLIVWMLYWCSFLVVIVFMFYSCFIGRGSRNFCLCLGFMISRLFGLFIVLVILVRNLVCVILIEMVSLVFVCMCLCSCIVICLGVLVMCCRLLILRKVLLIESFLISGVVLWKIEKIVLFVVE